MIYGIDVKLPACLSATIKAARYSVAN